MLSVDELRARRVLARLSQTALGRKAGISMFRVHKIENGLCQPRPGELEQIAAVLPPLSRFI